MGGARNEATPPSGGFSGSPFAPPPYAQQEQPRRSADSGVLNPSPLYGSPTQGTGRTPSLYDTPPSNPITPNYAALSGSSKIRPGMTREEIVLMQAEEARMRNMQDEEQHRRMMMESQFQRHLRTLFQESSDFRPKKLLKDTSAPKPKSAAELLQSGSKSKPEPPKPEPPERKPETVLSEDERLERELKAKRAELDRLEDSEMKKKNLEALNRREEARKRWLEQRAEAERGALLFSVPPSLQLTEQALKNGWCMLFDGSTFFGWRTQNEGPYAGGKFSIEGDCICSDPQHPGLLYTTAQFGDCSITFEYQTSKDAEVFLLLRSPPSPMNLHTSCYTVVLHSSDPSRPRGSIWGRQRLNEERIKHYQTVQEKETPEQWHRVKAQFDMMQLQVTIDKDEPSTLYDPSPLGYGYIGLLVTKGEAKFRTMLWNPGSKVSILSEHSFDMHWRKLNDEVRTGLTSEGELHLNGGPGALETKTLYGNFAMQCEYNVIYTSGKGSVFLRSIPRQAQTGRAVSLQNFPTRQDRDGGIGVDAGSFIGAKNARYLRPQDQRWNYLTVNAVGRQFQTWINGILVCEMTDKRPYSEQVPPQGAIQLSLTKDGSNVEFRNIRVSALPPRKEKTKTLEDWSKTTFESQMDEWRKREAEKKLDEQLKGK